MTHIKRSKSTLQLAFQSIASKLLLHATSVSSNQADDRLREVRDILQDSIQQHDIQLGDNLAVATNI